MNRSFHLKFPAVRGTCRHHNEELLLPNLLSADGEVRLGLHALLRAVQSLRVGLLHELQRRHKRKAFLPEVSAAGRRKRPRLHAPLRADRQLPQPLCRLEPPVGLLLVLLECVLAFWPKCRNAKMCHPSCAHRNASGFHDRVSWRPPLLSCRRRSL